MSFGEKRKGGVITWMARNPVAANLLMGLCILGGLFISFNIKQEVFPEFERDQVRVEVAYPGASPEEVEQGIVLAVEQGIEGLDGIKRVNGTAAEGMGVVVAELLEDADGDKVLADVKSAVDRLRSLPEEAERPVVSEVINRRHVISAIVHGDLPHETLRQLAESLRTGLVGNTPVTQAELSGVPPREIAIEIPQATLRAYGLTLDQVASVVRRASIELPGGALRTRGGDLLVRTTERRDLGREFGELVVKADQQGNVVRLRDVATIVDGFAETDQETSFDGQPAVKVDVYRVGDQTPVQIADAVRQYIDEQVWPPGVGVAAWDDQSEIFRDRIDLLQRNAAIGLVLVFVVLGLFLEIRLAFWVMVGIPISFLGSFLLMPILGVSINMISMFAFIIVLGLVVDDAIVVGENVYEMRQRGMTPMKAAIEGAKQMALPVHFAVATTIAAFSPLLFVPGFMGKIFGVIPLIVISVLLLSLVESLLILPAHLGHLKRDDHGWLGWVHRQQSKVARALDRHIEKIYTPVLRLAVRNRYLTAAFAIALLFVSAGLVRAGVVQFTFFPKIERDVVQASVRLPVGTSVEETREVQARLVEAAREVVRDLGGPEGLQRGLYAQLGQGISRGGPRGGEGDTGGHVTDVSLQLVPVDQRDVSAREVADRWREAVGRLTGIDTMSFGFSGGPNAGSPIHIELSHRDTEVLDRAAQDLARRLERYASEGIRDIDSGVTPGKPQLDATLKPAGRALGLTETDLARQLRGAFYGAEALRQQRQVDEVKVMVRLPRAEREKRHTLEKLVLRTPGGGEVPLIQAATLSPGFAETAIQRVDGRRVRNVTADVDETRGNANELLAQLKADVIPDLVRDWPGLSFSLEGEQREQRESMGAMRRNFLFALGVIFALLAVPFKSYSQPLLVMSVIPFGFVGALLGHLMLGYDLSIISIMGIIALAGVVVNDSLILIVATNEMVEEGVPPREAVVRGGTRRFRPILLTSLTTFFGLAPMIFETSVQARFLVPMAISLGFGVMFATALVLVLVPSVYLILEDLGRLWRGPPLPEGPDEQTAQQTEEAHA